MELAAVNEPARSSGRSRCAASRVATVTGREVELATGDGIAVQILKPIAHLHVDRFEQMFLSERP